MKSGHESSEGHVSLAEYLEKAPTDEEWAAEAAERHADMSPTERFRELSLLGAWMDTILAGQTPTGIDGEPPFWQLWKDPLRGSAG
jgi:hypothetical protein